ncbi:MAG: GNAT family N-acetyltransferase [Rubrobacter sp.]|nr:GNAT family N-acetyltransferase [Rubrobacter sp.]
MPPGLTLVQGGDDDLPLLDELPTTPDEKEARKRLEAGADLWFVLDGRQPSFACWIFHESLPMLAAPDGQLVLPAGIVCLENSVTSAAYRGRGVAPAAWSNIVDTLEELGEAKVIITKIEESNIASRRAILKSGFQESATMYFRLVGFWRRTTVRRKSGVTADWLAKALQKESL